MIPVPNVEVYTLEVGKLLTRFMRFHRMWHKKVEQMINLVESGFQPIMVVMNYQANKRRFHIFYTDGMSKHRI